MGRAVALLVVFMSLVLIGPAKARAQEATPAAGKGEVLDPAECQVEPRSADELIALWYQDDAAGTPVLATPEPEVMTAIPAPLGEPADAETVAGVTATLREVLACFTAGDFGRVLALFSDDLAQQFGLEPGQTPEDVRAFLAAPPEPVPLEERTRLIAITDVSVMADGRIGALVVSDDPTSPPEGVETEFVRFVQEGDRWLVDWIAEFTVVEEGNEETPAP